MRLAILDDSRLFGTALASLFQAGGAEVFACTDIDEFERTIERDHIDAAIVDLRMPPSFTYEGLRVMTRLKDQNPQIGVLLLTAYIEYSTIEGLLESGQSGVGYLLKDRVGSVKDLLDAIERVCAGEVVIDESLVAKALALRGRRSRVARLTSREQEILTLIVQGRSNGGIARFLQLSDRTVEVHVASIFNKLGIISGADHNKRVLAVLAALRDGAEVDRL